jgi:membrane-bound lytic murein transglycosylase A
MSTPGTAAPQATSTVNSGFATRHAYYEPARFTDLPGWNSDDLGASWDAFLRSCTVLGKRSGWSEPCAASRSVDARNAAAIRQFFETWFYAWQIRNTDKSTDGTITGYYEPLLNGSRQPGGAFIYPVYGTPSDMLYLDSRLVPDRSTGVALAARVEGRTVTPLADVAATGLKGVYALDLRDSVPDIRDKKIRLRLDHDRIVPYYTRADIERGALRAPVLAWVDDPVMLYSMQVQGSGKVRLRDGTILRFAYAEQNGRPFLPPIAHNTQAGGHKIVVRGMDMDVEVSEDAAPVGSAGSADPGPPDSTVHASGDSTEGADDEPVSPLLRGFKLASETPSSPSSSSAPSSPSTPATAKPAATKPAPASLANASSSSDTSPATGAATTRHAFAISDPSYVFFRLIPDSPNGPVGALGVPLSAGRSVAVDPRTTPLGAPVFVATPDDTSGAVAINRLMFAQDSGGAIQGAVRADYFFGFGQNAQSQASHTKQRLRMWVLLPKGLHISAQDPTLKTRGVGGPATSNADCLVSDPDLCVEDSQ